MKIKMLRFLVVAALILVWACSPKEEFKVGETYHGFKLVEKKFVKEINAECLLFTHEKSGARLLKIANDDPNKLFNIAFKTVPENDYGTPHVLEHALLNGSKNFPVKSPFDVLMQGSLNTFLNAMTGSDITTFPVASMNNKDYFNLMHVYLDAVFNPLIYSDPRILEQEGWHYELNSKDEPITYKGVVYSEMKGAYSSPERELNYQIFKILFPDNTYGVESGGYPTEIPKLTYNYFINFHKKFYHPSNSYILLYGNADLNKELEFIDSEYLSKYNKSDEKIEIPFQKPFDKMKEAEKTYAVPAGAPTNNQTYLTLSFVAGESIDRTLCMTFDVLTQALVNHESAPLRLALQEAGIGKDVTASFDEEKQNVFQITVKNANPEDKDKFKEVVFNTLEKVSNEGFDKSMVEGIINRTEFNLKEGDNANKGLQYVMMTYQPWFFANNPFLGLEFNKPLNEVKKALDSDLLQETVKKYLISNPHALLMVFKPEPGLQAKLDTEVTNELKAYKAGLNDAQLDKLVEETKELKDYQKKEDSPEALATIPTLKLSDIDTNIEWYPVIEKKVSDISVLHYNDFTNDIVYVNLYFDMKTLPEDLIPYAQLLSSVLGKLSTENYSFGELGNQLNIYTGGFVTSASLYLKNQSDDQLMPKFIVSSKANIENSGKLFDLAAEILNKSNFKETDRLKELITRLQSRLEANVNSNGMNYAMTRLESYFSNSGMFYEQTGGLDYYRFVTDISKNFDTKSEQIENKLLKTAQLLFTKQNLVAGVTCTDKDYPPFSGGMEKLVTTLPENDAEMNDWKFDLKKKNEGLLAASKVQYVIQGYDFSKLGYQYSGKMQVLRQVLSTDWLQNQVRVIGGAYGGYAGFSPNGNVYFASYRDPNLKGTLDIYNKTPDYLNNFEADDKAMTRFIIGTISRLDQPMTVSDKGDLAFRRHFENTTPEYKKAEREAVLTTSPDDIKSMSKLVDEILKKNEICVYGNEQKIKENKALFENLVSLTNE